MEHDRVVDLAHRPAYDARLAQRHPIFESALDDRALRRDLGHRIVVKHARLDWIADPAPMQRRHPVPGFGDGADVDKPSEIFLPVFVDRLYDVDSRAVVDLHRARRIVVRRRRDERCDVQHNVASFDAFEHF